MSETPAARDGRAALEIASGTALSRWLRPGRARAGSGPGVLVGKPLGDLRETVRALLARAG